MNKSTTENKLDRPGETKTVIDATDCPERFEHRGRLGSVCRGCDELIPGGGIYTPTQVARYFPGAAIVEAPRSTPDDEIEAWAVYDRLNQQANAATFRAEDLRIGGISARGYDVAAADRGIRYEQQMAIAIEEREKRRATSAQQLQLINKMANTRGARVRNAQAMESPSLVAREKEIVAEHQALDDDRRGR